MAKKKAVEVTTENFGKLLIEGLHEAVAVQQGTAEPARVRRRKMTARKVTVRSPGTYGARKIQQVRELFGVSQPVFARMMNVSPKAVRSWECGYRQPQGATRRLLELAERHPQVLTETVSPREGSVASRRAATLRTGRKVSKRAKQAKQAKRTKATKR